MDSPGHFIPLGQTKVQFRRAARAHPPPLLVTVAADRFRIIDHRPLRVLQTKIRVSEKKSIFFLPTALTPREYCPLVQTQRHGGDLLVSGRRRSRRDEEDLEDGCLVWVVLWPGPAHIFVLDP